MTKLIVALDHADQWTNEVIAKKLEGHVEHFKVGMTYFAAAGPLAITTLNRYGKVFCDLKLHDIPNQVGDAASALAGQGVWMFTVHASGGFQMIKSAVDATRLIDPRTGESSTEGSLVAGVTVLTSLSAKGLDSVGQSEDVPGQVRRLARLAVDAGAAAIVCSPHEIAMVREEVGDETLLIAPGIRPSGANQEDQRRVMTPAQAAEVGADFIVVGRPITSAEDPVRAAKSILEELG
jgi:orotidine-5'-phosphate decarboxylase